MNLQVEKEMNYQETVEKYSNMVYRLAYFYTNCKYDADDIFQEVFLKYLQNKKQFENEEHKKAWLIKVTINSCKKMWLSCWKRKIISLNDELFNVTGLPLSSKSIYCSGCSTSKISRNKESQNF